MPFLIQICGQLRVGLLKAQTFCPARRAALLRRSTARYAKEVAYWNICEGVVLIRRPFKILPALTRQLAPDPFQCNPANQLDLVRLYKLTLVAR